MNRVVTRGFSCIRFVACDDSGAHIRSGFCAKIFMGLFIGVHVGMHLTTAGTSLVKVSQAHIRRLVLGSPQILQGSHQTV